MKSHRLVSGNPDTIISDGIFEILTGQTTLCASIFQKKQLA